MLHLTTMATMDNGTKIKIEGGRILLQVSQSNELICYKDFDDNSHIYLIVLLMFS